MHRFYILMVAVSILVIPETAAAYVGPGAGLSLLSALWALMLALFTAIIFVLAYPIRRLLRRRSTNQKASPRAGGYDRAEARSRRA
jgi:membrane protein implicated in regulation of membrane protease activity